MRYKIGALVNNFWALKAKCGTLRAKFGAPGAKFMDLRANFFVPGKKYFAGNYGFTLKKIESVVVVVVVKSSERFKALPIELES